jgi:hypothetical protein
MLTRAGFKPGTFATLDSGSRYAVPDDGLAVSWLPQSRDDGILRAAGAVAAADAAGLACGFC